MLSDYTEPTRFELMTSGVSSSAGPESLFRGYSGHIFLLVTFGVMIANIGRQALPPLLPAIIEELVITPAAAGIALTLMRICFAALQYPSGRVADKISRKVVIITGLIVMIVGFVMLVHVSTYSMFIFSVTLLGLGSALFFVSERVLLSDLFVEKRGLAFGTNSAISGMGSILGAGLAVTALSFGAWQSAFLPVVTVLTGTTVGFHIVSREQYSVSELRELKNDESQLEDTVRRVFGTMEVRWLVIAYTLTIFVWEAVIVFLPLYLQEAKGLNIDIASGGFAVLFAVGIIVQPIAGSVSDWLDRRLIAGIATFLSIIGLAVLIVSQSFVLIVIGIVLYSAGLKAFTPVVHAHVMDLFPKETKGGDLGAFKTVYEGISSLGPTYVGLMIGLVSYDVAFMSLLFCLIGSGSVFVWLRYTRSRRKAV